MMGGASKVPENLNKHVSRVVPNIRSDNVHILVWAASKFWHCELKVGRSAPRLRRVLSYNRNENFWPNYQLAQCLAGHL